MSLEIVIIIIGTVFASIMIGVTWFINRNSQPSALWLLFFTEMWERFSFYGMRALLILYMTNVLMYEDKVANLQYGAYNALVYTMPLFGGIIADRLLGFRKSIVLGGILMAIGHCVLAIPDGVLAGKTSFFLGLGFLISGNGFFKPNISSLLGRFYEKTDPRKDAGYSIFYMGINVGAFLGSALCGYVGQEINWHYGFGIAGIFMIVGLITFLLFKNSVLRSKNFDREISARAHETQSVIDSPLEREAKISDAIVEMGHSPKPELMNKRFLGIKVEWLLYLGAFAIVPLAMGMVQLEETMKLIMGGLALLTLIYIFILSMLEKKIQMQQLWAATLMILFSVLFWGFYEQSGGALNLMAERNVDMHIGDTLLSSAMVNNSINPFYIIFLTPIFAMMWDFLSKRKLEPNTPVKFGLAFLFVGLGYYVFVAGGQSGAASGMMPLIYFMMGYFFITTGELFLSPIGLSMITKLSPIRMVGFMMGVWFLASAFGHELAGWIGSKMSIDKSIVDPVLSLPIYMKGCQQIAIVSLVGGVLILLSSFIIKRWMHGTK